MIKQLLTIFLFCSNALAAQDSLFFTGYDLIAKNNFVSKGKLIQLKDSSLVLACIKSDDNQEFLGVRVTRFLSNGNVIWSNLLNTSAQESHCDAIESSDSNLLIAITAYESATMHNQVSLVKIDEAGNLIWDATLDGTDPIYRCYALEAGSSYFLIFQTHSTQVNDYVADVAKFSSEGNLIWHKQYSMQQAFVDGVVANQNQLILTGDLNIGDYCMFKIVLDTDGIIVSGKKFIGGIGDTHSCRFDLNGNLIIAGTWNTNYGYILKLDNQDSVIFCKKIEFGTNNDEVWDILQSSDSSYYVLAEPESYYNYSQTGLMKFNKNGDFLWMKVYGDSSRLFPFNAIMNQNSSITIAGTQGSWNNVAQIYLLKVDSEGNSVCPPITYSPQIEDLIITTQVSGQDYSANSTILQTMNGSSESISSYSICDSLALSITNYHTSDLSLDLSPNPASSYINIVYGIEQNATLTFTNTYGSVVKQLTLYPYFSAGSHGKKRIVYVDELPAGVYLVTLHEGDKILSKKMVLLR